MAEWFITGKKGAGKSLCSVGKIQDYLRQNRRVATNLDLKLHNLIGPRSKNCNVQRLPDYPQLSDLLAMGVGNPTIKYTQKVTPGTGAIFYDLLDSPSFDESKNGLIVLDELATWMNTRSFQDKSRGPVLDWLVHARKYGWDILYIMQDICQIDKQARESFAEMVAYCKRVDRMSVPFVGFLLSIFGLKIPMPRVHLAVVLYGSSKTSPVCDRWVYRGNNLFSGYNTLQKFSSKYSDSVFCYLPPYQTHGRFKMVRSFGGFMRLTRIVCRRFSRPLSFAVGILLVCLIQLLYYNVFSGEVPAAAVVTARPQPVDLSFLDGYSIYSHSLFPGQAPLYTFKNSEGKILTSSGLLARGLHLSFISDSKIVVTSAGVDHAIFAD